MPHAIYQPTLFPLPLPMSGFYEKDLAAGFLISNSGPSGPVSQEDLLVIKIFTV